MHTERHVAHVRRWWLLVALCLLALAGMGSAQASPPSGYGKFLPPNKAFQLSAHPRAHAVVLSWRIADGYYLYRKKFVVHADAGTIGHVQFPPGVVDNDPNFGRVQVFRREVRVNVPVTKAAAGHKVGLVVTYQGCANAGLCYPPITRRLTVKLGSKAAVGMVSAHGQAGSGSGSGPVKNVPGHLAQLVVQGNPLWFIAVFFGLGVLLSFTPCVLPMVPILAGILGKRGDRNGLRSGFLLSLTYALAMAAVYTAAGVVAGLVGVGLQGFFQTPWIIGLFALVFVALALSLFGLYELRLPAFVTRRVDGLSNRVGGHGFAGAATMGALAALIVSPCVAAPVAGALVAIGQAGSPVRGGMALAALALGMGTPLVVYGSLAGRLLPKAGGWMVAVERLFGLLMLGYAVWLLGRVIPQPVVLALWGGIALVAAWMLLRWKPGVRRWAGSLVHGGAALATIAGLILIVGGATGGARLSNPLAGLTSEPAVAKAMVSVQPVDSLAALSTQLATAAHAGRPVMVEFGADWCTACLDMEHTTLRDGQVVKALRQFQVLQVDVTSNSAADRALLKHFGLYGPPAYLFFDSTGQRLKSDAVIGYLAAPLFLQHVQRALG